MGKKLTNEQFLERIVERNGDKFDYSQVSYTGTKGKIILTCPKHGPFQTRADRALQGCDCPECSGVRVSNQTFIQRCMKIHGNKYSYDKTRYIDMKSPVVITCPRHGDFVQLPDNHIRGHGCPHCKSSKGEQLIKSYLEGGNICFKQECRIQVGDKVIYVDFMLDDQQTVIEYNGIQHYRPVEFFGGEVQFQKQIERDKILKEFCQHRGWNLIEIPYTLDEKQISQVLNDKLKANYGNDHV